MSGRFATLILLGAVLVLGAAPPSLSRKAQNGSSATSLRHPSAYQAGWLLTPSARRFPTTSTPPKQSPGSSQISTATASRIMYSAFHALSCGTTANTR